MSLAWKKATEKVLQTSNTDSYMRNTPRFGNIGDESGGLLPPSQEMSKSWCNPHIDNVCLDLSAAKRHRLLLLLRQFVVYRVLQDEDFGDIESVRISNGSRDFYLA